MHHVARDGDAVLLGLYRIEMLVVREFVHRMAARIRIDDVEDLDPFALWEQSLLGASEGDGGAEVDDEDRDPLLDRLFPSVFPDDPRASAEHRRFSEGDLRRQKASEADLVLAALDSARVVGHEGDDEIVEAAVASGEVDAWLRTLNATRLALALELGVTDVEDAEELDDMADDDPREYPYSVYEFLGELQAIILAAVGGELWNH